MVTANRAGELVFPIHFLELVESLVRAGRGDASGLRRECGLAGDEDRLTLPQFTALLQAGAASFSGHEPPALQLLRHMPVTAHGMIGVAAMTSETLGDALDVGLRYFPLILPTHELLRMTVGNQVHVLIQRRHSFGNPTDEILTEMIPGGFFQMVMFAGQGAPGVAVQDLGMAVHFSHQARTDVAAYEAFFRGSVRFGCADDRFVVSRAGLARPLLTRNRTTQAAIEKMLEQQLTQLSRQHPVSRKVRRILSVSLLQDRVPDAAAIADELAISVRTLSRRLSSEGTGLDDLLDEVRAERGEALLLGSNLPLTAIARKLGYSELSTFSRAFKRARGVTPSELRAESGNAEPRLP